MITGDLKEHLERLIAEAPRIAPSMSRYENRNYGKVTDENLDNQSFLRWRIEAETLVNGMAKQGPSFQILYDEYLDLKDQAKKFHSQSIFVHKTMEILGTALQLVGSPSAVAIPSSLDQERRNEAMSPWTDLLHDAVLASSIEQYKNAHWRNSVLDAFIAVFELVRHRTGLDLDGEALITRAFSVDRPLLVVADLATESGRNDQVGFMMMLQGAYRGVRNPKAHSLQDDLTAHKAAQYLVLASLLCRRIEEADQTGRGTAS